MKENKNQSISEKLADTVSKTNSIELPAEILEFTVDQVINEGILKEIPFVGWLAKGVSVSRSISDRIFHHKILRFLVELENVSKGDRDKFRKRIELDEKYRRKVGEHLILLLNKIDAFEKTSLLAICFDHFLIGDIDYEYFVDLSNVIEKSTVSDLKSLCVPTNKRVIFNSVGIAVASGILEYGISSLDLEFGGQELETKISTYGNDIRYMFLGTYREKQAEEIEKRKQFEKLLMK